LCLGLGRVIDKLPARAGQPVDATVSELTKAAAAVRKAQG
jgi:hypothetical protein